MKNKISDLNDHLFSQLERLGNEKLSGEELNDEINRTNAIVRTANALVESGSLALRATELQAEYMGLGNSNNVKLPLLLEPKAEEVE